ncbi:MAG TPA: hypothetical protein DIT99_04480 [Candidatus Latescibacteria bacterium]|nr:hypothetical protein [Candidatus Latescibacterota bacterium]
MALPAQYEQGRTLGEVDNEVNLTMLLDMLSGGDHDVAGANNGHKAVGPAPSFKLDFIVMGIQMPVMDGVDATNRLRPMPAFNEIRLQPLRQVHARVPRTHIWLRGAPNI